MKEKEFEGLEELSEGIKRGNDIIYRAAQKVWLNKGNDKKPEKCIKIRKNRRLVCCCGNSSFTVKIKETDITPKLKIVCTKCNFLSDNLI